MNKNRKILSKIVVVLMAGFLITGCTTHMAKSSREVMPSKVKLNEFKEIEMKAVGISEKHSLANSNQEALKKIDEILFREMKLIFPNLKRIKQDGDFLKTEGKTLQITPFIKEIKFIGEEAPLEHRFYVGDMAESSAVLMMVTLRDSSNDEIIADPEFYHSVREYSGGWSVWDAENRMLKDIAKDIVNYCSFN